MADLDRIRRFSLSTALVLLTLSIAGVALEPDARISPMGFPLRLTRPNLLPIGIAVAVFYGMVRFYYYGIMLGTSPYRKRRDILDSLYAEGAGSGKRVPLYFGPTKFRTTPWHWDRERVESRAAEIPSSFPKFAGARVSATVVSDTFTDENGEPCSSYAVELQIPVRCRIAALVQDLDYAAPVWFTFLALLLFVFQLSRTAA